MASYLQFCKFVLADGLGFVVRFMDAYAYYIVGTSIAATWVAVEVAPVLGATVGAFLLGVAISWYIVSEYDKWRPMRAIGSAMLDGSESQNKVMRYLCGHAHFLALSLAMALAASWAIGVEVGAPLFACLTSVSLWIFVNSEVERSFEKALAAAVDINHLHDVPNVQAQTAKAPLQVGQRCSDRRFLSIAEDDHRIGNRSRGGNAVALGNSNASGLRTIGKSSQG